MPAMPHMLDGLRVAAAFGRRAIDELTEPELEHHQLPQAMAVIGAPVAMLGPEARDLAVVEHAPIAQAAVAEQRVRHRCQRTAQPLADRRFEAMLAALENLRRNLALQGLAQQIFPASVLQLQRR